MTEEQLTDLLADGDIEERRLKADIILRHGEQQIRQREYEAKLKADEHTRKQTFSPMNITFLIAILGLIGNFIGNLVQSNASLALERKKFNSELIMKSIQESDRTKTEDNLRFLATTGLIDNSDDRLRSILRLLDDKKLAPQFTHTLQTTKIVYVYRDRQIVKPIYLRTPGSQKQTARSYIIDPADPSDLEEF